jgi:ABC-2 type transport system ATP-binding protein
VIEVVGLTKRRPGGEVLRDVSFQVLRGEIFGIIGPDGAGKTTTIECLAGVRKPDAGRISVLGLDPQRHQSRVRQQVGVQLRRERLPKAIKVCEVLELFGSGYAHQADHEDLLIQCGLSETRDLPYSELTERQQHRLSIAVALLGNPEIVLLDEFAPVFDPHTQRDVSQLIQRIRERGTTVVLVTRSIAEAERLCDRIALLADGRLVAVDTPAGLLSRVDAEQRLRFRPSAPLPERVLTDLPEVTSVTTTADRTVVVGTADLLLAVTSALARHRVMAADLKVEKPNLQDVYVALTGG